MAQVTPAYEHDIRAAREILSFVHAIIVFADKAYCDQEWSKELQKQGIKIYTPAKELYQGKVIYFSAN
jgi:hypothetical protein